MMGSQSDQSAPRLIRILLKLGFQSQRHAERALLIFAVVCIVLTLVMLTPKKVSPPQNDIQQNPNYEPTTLQ